MGSVLFESRIGALENPPSKGAQEFVHNLMGFFKYMQPLMYNMPVYKYINTPTWRTYEEYGDKVHEAGLKMVQKVSTGRRGGGMGAGYKYINTLTWRRYEEYGDKVHEAGLKMVQKVSTGRERGWVDSGMMH